MRKKTETFKRTERLKERLVFGRLFKEGAYFSSGGVSAGNGKSGNFSLRYIRNKLNITRLGISLRKKTFPKAVQRNSIKRLIREIFRRNKGCLNKGLDIVIKPESIDVLKLGYEEVEKELLALFNKAKILIK